MRTLLLALFIVGIVGAVEERKKRQTDYGGYGGNYGGAATYRQPQQQLYQQQPQQSYRPQQQQAYGGQQVQQYPQQAVPPRQQSAPDEEDKNEGPHPLQLLLDKSKFECGSKSDGYYADSDVGCQAFHYCVSGQKHSMMCPAGTVFHQVHLNCVPSDQDICSKANKFFFVNDYLNKPLEQRGPNNTVQYHQRYYPENYAAGDPFIPPQEGAQREPPAATYGLGPAYRVQQPPPSPAQYQPPAPQPQQQSAPYTPQQQQYAYQRPVQPSRPASAYPQAQSQALAYAQQQQQALYAQQQQQAQRAYAQQAQQLQGGAPQQQQPLYRDGVYRARYPQQY